MWTTTETWTSTWETMSTRRKLSDRISQDCLGQISNRSLAETATSTAIMAMAASPISLKKQESNPQRKSLLRSSSPTSTTVATSTSGWSRKTTETTSTAINASGRFRTWAVKLLLSEV